MPDKSENSESDPGSNPLRSWPSISPELESEARTLIDAALNGLITPVQHQRLEQLVIETPSVARLYLEIVHLWYSIPLHVSRGALDLNAGKTTAQAASDDPMDQTMILPALKESDLKDDDFEVFLPPPYAAAPPTPVSKRKWWLGGAAAAVLILGISIFLATRGNRPAPAQLVNPPETVVIAKPPATITATAAITPVQSGYAIPGTALAAGQVVQLEDGAAEVTFASGAVAVVHGPARLRIVDENSAVLDEGEIALHVPVEARGFHLDSPGLSVVDRGTNFGVRALADGTASEVHVFGGKVDAEGTDSAGRTTSQVIHMSEGEAVRHAVAAVSAPVPIAFKPAAFIRDITQVKVPIPMHNTGDQTAAGAADPNWQIVSVPGNPNWKPRPAMVPAGLNTMYTQYMSAGSWIAVNAAMDDQPAGIFTFRTSVDLTGFDPATVSVIATVAADDYVADIRINGASTGLSNENKQNHNFYEKTDLAIPAQFWHPGVNQVDVVVGNRPQTFAPNCLALHVDWTASALAVVHR